LKDTKHFSHPIDIRELLEGLQEASLDFGVLKDSKFKLTHTWREFYNKDTWKQLVPYINLFMKDDLLILYKLSEVHTIVEHSWELNYDDIYYEKIGILEERENMELIITFLSKFEKDISDFWIDSEDHKMAELSRIASMEKMKEHRPYIHFLWEKTQELTFNQETGDVSYKKKLLWNLPIRNRSYKFFLALYRYFGKYTSYEDLNLLMWTWDHASIDAVFYSDIYNKEIPSPIKEFIKKERLWYRLVDTPLKVKKRNP